VGCITGRGVTQRNPFSGSATFQASMKDGRTALVPASAAGVRQAAAAFDAFARQGGIPVDVVRSVQVALDEVLSNTVRHGYGDAGDRRGIQIRFQLDEDGVLEVTIEDDAPPFDPRTASVPDTTAGLAERTPGGLGLLLTRGLMDEMDYARANGRNRVTLRKRTGAP
jgi:serine/threonine-protein kinase RsbW